MSLAAPDNESPEFEALQRAQRAHEPSMEEILASIRAIIADDTTPTKTGPQLVYASDAPARPQPEAPRKPEPAAPMIETEEPLLSESAGAAVSGSFRALSESMAAHGAKVAEDMAREMLRPMLKVWLDENMPAMVERLVKAEIERLARTGG